MKKILLSASVCALALFTGCTKDIANNGGEQGKDAVTFIGTTAENATRVTLGDATSETTSVPILWSNTDAIGIFTSEYPKPGDPETMMTRDNAQYIATTTEPSTSTGFQCNFGSPIDTKTAGVKFWAYYPLNVMNTDKAKIASPLKVNQSWSAVTNDAPDKIFMVAKEAVADATQNIVPLKFTNSFAIINVGLKGNALIDGIEITGFTKAVAMDGGTLDITKAPAAGTTADAFMASGFYTPAGAVTPDPDPAPLAGVENGVENGVVNGVVKMNFGTPIRLVDEYKRFPLMILPTEFDTAVGITLNVHFTDKDGNKQVMPMIFGKLNTGTKAINTNDIIYLNPTSLNAEELNQDEPKEDFKPGDLIFSDDFSWLPEIFTKAGPNFLNSGWASVSYNNEDWSETKSVIDDNNDGFYYPLIKKYTSYSAAYAMAGSNGSLLLGSTSSEGSLKFPLDLQAATANLKFTFKAAKYQSALGKDDKTAKTFDVTIDGPGTIKGGAEKKATITPTSICQWTDYTVVIEGATAATSIIFGNTSAVTGRFLADDLKVVIADPSDVNNLTGTLVARPTAEIKDVTPEEDTAINVGWSKDGQFAPSSSFTFTVTGKWAITGCPTWLRLNPVWNSNDYSPTAAILTDAIGNELPTVMEAFSQEANPNSQPRSATITLTATDNSSATRQFTITQAAAPAATVLFQTGFGTITDVTPLVKGVTDFGATIGGDLIIENFDEAGNNTKGELTNLTLLRGWAEENETGVTYEEATYAGATNDGCYNFKKISGYETYDVPNLGFGVKIKVPEGAQVVTVSFGMYLGFDKTGYDAGKNYINIFNNNGYNEIKNVDLVKGWNYYTKTLKASDAEGGFMDITIYPPLSTKGAASRSNSVLLDDVKITVQ